METNKIKKAYEDAGLNWEDIKHYVDGEGWLNKSIFQYTQLKYHQITTACSHIGEKCRPITLNTTNQ